MNFRKQMKKEARSALKKHYVIFAAACLIAAFLSAEFTGALNFSRAQDYEQILLYEEEGKEVKVTSNITGVGWADILRIMAEKDTEAGEEMSRQLQEKAVQEAAQGNPMFGRTRGVLSGVVNQVSSGSILVTATAAIASFTGSDDAGVMVLILLGALGMFLFWALVQNVFPVVVRRVFLEGMIYDRVTPQRFVFLLRVRKWLKASWIMLVKYLFYTLWCLTVVGAFVKRYSYFLVPYIAAENPDLTARQAITLSRKMMKGHKWECFVFELSFLGWEILGAATLGVFNILYTNPYKTAAFTRYYGRLRTLAQEKEIPGAQLLCDPYLYEKADPGLLVLEYADVIEVMENPPEEAEGMTSLSGWRGVLARNFGILVFRREQERQYEQRQAQTVRLQALMDDARGEAYPVRLYPIPEEERRKLVESLNYMRHYSVWSLVMIFFSLSVFGWLFEVGMHLVSYGEFVNRGALHGPWIPIYGTGAVLMLTILNRLRRNPALEFLATILLCGFLEYMTSFVMELASGGTKWWDYSGYFLNLHGRICAEGLLVFGVGGLAIVYAIAPMIDTLTEKISGKILKPVCVIFITVFVMDAVYSQIHPNVGKGVTDIEETVSVSIQTEKSC